MKNIHIYTGAALLALTVFRPAFAEDPVYRAVFINAQGAETGSALLTDTGKGVLIALDLENLPPGAHGFHIHEKGDCSPSNASDPAKNFAGAGAHLNIPGHEHGFMHEGGPHPGDLPNLEVSTDGTAKAGMFNEHLTLRAEKDGHAKLLDADGAALMVHAKADDYTSQPSGESGDRIACAKIR